LAETDRAPHDRRAGFDRRRLVLPDATSIAANDLPAGTTHGHGRRRLSGGDDLLGIEDMLEEIKDFAAEDSKDF
jgi:hypothetical protein